MANPRDREFRPRPSAPGKDRDAARPFVQRVIRATYKAGAPKRFAGSGKGRTAAQRAQPGVRFGRGHVAAKLAEQRQGVRGRRAVVKTRLVNLRQASAQSTQIHLRYVQRDAVSREGGAGKLYGPEGRELDATAFDERCREDRHQFRFIISPEEAIELEDLQRFTRQLMQQMQKDLGTGLEWVAVDHWDTDNPHTHIIVRGRDQSGEDLLISSEYLTRGLRLRVEEIATQWLGPRTELEIRQSLAREVQAERYTDLDRSIEQRLDHGAVDLSARPAGIDVQRERVLLVGRLQHLDRMGLAQQLEADVWAVLPGLKETLIRMGERGDLIRTLQRAVGDRAREARVYDPQKDGPPITGRILGKGLADELSDQAYVIIEGTDGYAHYARLSPQVDLRELSAGSIVTVRAAAIGRAADRNIAALAEQGLYRTSTHLDRAEQGGMRERDAQEFVRSHVRRLEALRRAGITERLEEGLWRVPPDFIEQARAYDRSRSPGAIIDIRSHLTLEQQTRAIGATWLDQQLARRQESLADVGFGAETRIALRQRGDFLVGQGWAHRQGNRVVLDRGQLERLKTRELEARGAALAQETGLLYRPAADGERIGGTYSRSVNLASGRFAMLDDGLGFTLVPWQSIIEPHRGRHISALIRGDHISWDFGRQRGIGR
jgi:type IV secretory pathway VirD2 relaxase